MTQQRQLQKKVICISFSIEQHRIAPIGVLRDRQAKVNALPALCFSGRLQSVSGEGLVPLFGSPSGADTLRLVVQLQFRNKKGVPMHEETFNLSIRKFLKIVGINSQREIEQVVRKALEEGHIKGDETFPASVTLAVPELNLSFKIDGEIRLQ